MAETPDLRARFLADIQRNPHVGAIFARWDRLVLPGGWLVAGCLFQTVWNLREGKDPTAGIKDYDFFYFDAADLSEKGEQSVQCRLERELADLGVTLEAKNQARVHLWYQDHFGHPYPQLHDAREGIDRFLVTCTCVGVRPAAGDFVLYAPHGLAMLYDGVLAHNPLTDHRALFDAKTRSYQERWPWLRLASPPCPAPPPWRASALPARAAPA